MRMRNFFLAILFTSSAVAQNIVSIDLPDVIDPGLTFVASISRSNQGSVIPVPFGAGFPPSFVVQSVDEPCQIVATANRRKDIRLQQRRQSRVRIASPAAFE